MHYHSYSFGTLSHAFSLYRYISEIKDSFTGYIGAMQIFANLVPVMKYQKHMEAVIQGATVHVRKELVKVIKNKKLQFKEK